MKKIISILLVALCLFAMISCNGNTDLPDDVKDIYAIAQSGKTPTQINTSILYEGEFDGEPLKLEGFYKQSIDGENSVFDFWYDRLTTVDELADAPIVREKGTITYKDGKTSTDGKTWNPESPAAVRFDVEKFNFDKKLLLDPELDADGLTVTATVEKENVKAVLGTELNIMDGTDVTVSVTIDGVALRTIVIDYVTPEDAAVTVTSSYSYNKPTSGSAD